MKPRTATNTLTVHCAYTKPSQDIGAETIRQWHKDKGWSDIGYHFVIRRDGTLETGREFHRQGAHVAGHNHNSVGICLVGGMSEQGNPEPNYTDAQFITLRQLLDTLMHIYPHAQVKGHRDFEGVTKPCPCFDVAGWYKKP